MRIPSSLPHSGRSPFRSSKDEFLKSVDAMEAKEKDKKEIKDTLCFRKEIKDTHSFNGEKKDKEDKEHAFFSVLYPF